MGRAPTKRAPRTGRGTHCGQEPRRANRASDEGEDKLEEDREALRRAIEEWFSEVGASSFPGDMAAFRSAGHFSQIHVIALGGRSSRRAE